MRVTKCLHRPVAHCPVMGGVPGNDRNMDLTLNPPQDPAPKVGYDYNQLECILTMLSECLFMKYI